MKRLVFAVALLAACEGGDPAPARVVVPTSELYKVAPDSVISPVVAGNPAKGVTVWIMTRLGTRKVEQMRRHPQVTLYFNSDDRVEYATIMGTAIIHRDPENPTRTAMRSSSGRIFRGISS